MKKLSALTAVLGLAFISAASAADITIFYSPYCPHCHHARAFVENTLIYEYPTVSVRNVNVMEEANLPMFQDTLEKCKYESGGVPVIVVGEKCFQGYADFMQDDLRTAVEADLSDNQKSQAAENKKALADNADEFKSKNASRADAVTEYNAATAQKKSNENSTIWFYGLLIVLVGALGFVLIRKDKKK